MTFASLISHLSSLFAKRGWQQAWARGDDLGIGSHGSVRLAKAAQQSAWVFRCLQLIAGPIRSVPLEWFAPHDDQAEIKDADLLAFWRRPAITAGGVRLSCGDFFELSSHHIGLTGQAFWILDDTWLERRARQKNPILLARAERMTAIQNGDVLLGWRFLDGAGKSFSLLPQQVIRPRFLSPYDDAAGLAPLDAAWIAASADHAAGLFARNVAESNGDQGVYVVSKSGTLSDEQRAQIVASLRQKAALAKRGDFRAAFLTADVAIEDPKIKSVDAAFLEGRHFSRDEIAAAFGVPPSMLQKMESYSIGAASDRYRLIDETCMPMGARFEEAVAEVERLRTGADLIPRFKWAQHPVLSEVRNEKLKAATAVWKCGVPWSVLNDTMDLGLDDFAGSNQAWLPMSLEPVPSDAGTPARNDSTTNTTTDADTTPTTDLAKTLTHQRTALSDLQTLLATAQQDTNREPQTANSEPRTENSERQKLWHKHLRARSASEKLFKAKFNKVVMAARRETLAKIEASDKHLSGVRERGVLDLIFDLAQFTLSMQSEMTKAHRAAIDEATSQFLLEIARPDDPWRMEASQVLNFLNTRENFMRDAAREVFNQIQATLQEGLSAGETTAELAARVREAFNGISNERAVMIAATETGAAYGQTRHAAIQDLDVPYKQWLSAQDGNVRDTHMRIDGTILPADEPFRVPTKDGGEDLMMHPCDSAGSPGNVIHCRCVEIPMMDEGG
jgi:SPP1 gp7 family putative phage head morphogenesis protein